MFSFRINAQFLLVLSIT